MPKEHKGLVNMSRNMIKDIISSLKSECFLYDKNHRIEHILDKRRELMDFASCDKGTDIRVLKRAMGKHEYLQRLYPEYKSLFPESPLFPVLLNRDPGFQYEIDTFIHQCAKLGMSGDQTVKAFIKEFERKLCSPDPELERRRVKREPTEDMKKYRNSLMAGIGTYHEIGP